MSTAIRLPSRTKTRPLYIHTLESALLPAAGIEAKSLSGRGGDRKFTVRPDDTALFADDADSTRVVLRVTDKFDVICTYANDPIVFTLEGPAEIIGDNPFSLIGGTGAIWIRAKEGSGTVRVTAQQPRLGSNTVEFTLQAVPAEEV